MNGKPGVAPCGHDGEYVIGAFVLCGRGCDGKGVMRRGEPGHVNRCACKPCQLRRTAHKILIKSTKGELIASIDWDGVTDDIKFIPQLDYFASDFQMLDETGKIVAQGVIADTFGGPVSLIGGWSATIKTKMLIDKVHLAVMQGLDPGLPTNKVGGVPYGRVGAKITTIRAMGAAIRGNTPPHSGTVSGKIII